MFGLVKIIKHATTTRIYYHKDYNTYIRINRDSVII